MTLMAERGRGRLKRIPLDLPAIFTRLIEEAHGSGV